MKSLNPDLSTPVPATSNFYETHDKDSCGNGEALIMYQYREVVSVLQNMLLA